MQTALFISNKQTRAAEFLEGRNIFKVVESLSNLNGVDVNTLGIVDVDKLIYIHYAEEDDIQLRTDMNILRTLLKSAFFHVREIIAILVDANQFASDLIKSACRDYDEGTLEVIEHSGKLLLNDLLKYITGSTAGDNTESTYKPVYIAEASKQDRQLYVNRVGEVGQILPQLADMYSLYHQRANNEAIVSGRTVLEKTPTTPVLTSFEELQEVEYPHFTGFLISGDLFTGYENAAIYLAEQIAIKGRHSLIVNLDSNVHLDIEDSYNLTFNEIRTQFFSKQNISVLNTTYNKLSLFISYIDNLKSIDSYIFIIPSSTFSDAKLVLSQLCETTFSIYVAHYTPECIEQFLARGISVNSLFLSDKIFKEDVDVLAYKEELHGTLCAMLPNREDVDLVEFYQFCQGVDEDGEI